jgi:hypothetical protein
MLSLRIYYIRNAGVRRRDGILRFSMDPRFHGDDVDGLTVWLGRGLAYFPITLTSPGSDLASPASLPDAVSLPLSSLQRSRVVVDLPFS